MRHKSWPLLLPLLILVLSPLAGVAAEGPEEVMKQVQATYDKTGTFQARFQQESRLTALHETDSAAGWVYFQKPSRMLWKYRIARGTEEGNSLRRQPGVDVHAPGPPGHGL